MSRAATLTLGGGGNKIAPMNRLGRLIILAVATVGIATGCGVAYQAGTRIKAAHIADSLRVGQSSPEIHRRFGEPDIRQYLPGDTEVWSYPAKPNSNDLTAALLYTSTKDGDQGTFLDLKFAGGKLVSWTKAEHTMPLKGHTGIGMGIGGGPVGNGTETTPGAVHY